MNLGELFTTDQWERFDSLPPPLQKMLVDSKKSEYQLYSKRYQRNCGALGSDLNHIWTDKLVKYVIKEIEKIKKTDEFIGSQRRKDTEFQAYVILAKNLFKILEKDNQFVVKNWKTLGKSGQEKIIQSYAKAYQAAVHRHKKKKVKKI